MHSIFLQDASTTSAGATTSDAWYAVPISAFDTANSAEGVSFSQNLDPAVLEQAPQFDMETFGEERVLEEGYDNEWQEFWNEAGFSMDMDTEASD